MCKGRFVVGGECDGLHVFANSEGASGFEPAGEFDAQCRLASAEEAYFASEAPARRRRAMRCFGDEELEDQAVADEQGAGAASAVGIGAQRTVARLVVRALGRLAIAIGLASGKPTRRC